MTRTTGSKSCFKRLTNPQSPSCKISLVRVKGRTISVRLMTRSNLFFPLSGVRVSERSRYVSRYETPETTRDDRCPTTTSAAPSLSKFHDEDPKEDDNSDGDLSWKITHGKATVQDSIHGARLDPRCLSLYCSKPGVGTVRVRSPLLSKSLSLNIISRRLRLSLTLFLGTKGS